MQDCQCRGRAPSLCLSTPLLVCPFGRRYLRSMQSRMEEEVNGEEGERRGEERLRSLMKIMISLKTYSSLPLTAAEEKEEEEFSVKARYNAEREREKNAGGLPSIYCKCNCTTATAATGKWRARQPSGHSKFENKTLRTRTHSVTPYLSCLLPSTLMQPLPARGMTTETH